MARNLLEQHVYSHATGALCPSLIRLPGYPLFLAAVYAVSGTQTIQRSHHPAVLDTAPAVLMP